ncbi:MAG: SurA N-terminal domain-containing protein [Solirubrobacterales bacterium]
MGDSETAGQPKTRFCHSCGAELGDPPGSFCPECGTKLSTTEQGAKLPHEEKSSRTLLWVVIAVVAAAGVGAAISALASRGGSDDGSSLPSPSDLPPDTIALVMEVPEGAGRITEGTFYRHLDQAAAKGQLDKVPAPGDPEYRELKETTVGELIQAAWIKGQANEMGISVTAKEVDKKHEKLKEQSFDSEAEYRKTVEELHFTEADVRGLMELELLTEKIQKELREDSPRPSDSEIEDYYEEVKADQFTKPNGDVQPLDEVEDQIRAMLKQQGEGKAFERFVKDFEDRWRSRTVCAPGFAVEACSNGKRKPQPEPQDQDSDLPEAPPAP